MPTNRGETPYADVSHMSDEALAEACRERDGSALEELMKRYMRQIFNFSRQYARTSEDAEDIAQDTFYKVWKYIGHYSAGKQFRPWIFTIARNTALDYIKKKRASAFSDLDDTENDLAFADTLEDPEPLPSDIFEQSAVAAKLTEALKHIHPDHRVVLLLHYQDGMTFDEIASVVRKPMNTVKSWHRRALIRLREILTAEAHQYL